jgi:hypothetical protein
MTTTNSNSVSWASGEPFNTDAYATGEWGDYVSSLSPLTLDPSLENAMILNPQEQREFAASYDGPKRFRKAVEYRELLDRVDEARGF